MNGGSDPYKSYHFRLLPLSIYLHKTATISKYLQFLIYKLNESVVGTRWSTNNKLEIKRYEKKKFIKRQLITAI